MRGFVPLILLVSLLYAATYLFIKVAVEELSPEALVALRLLLAAPVLVLLLARRTGVRAATTAVRAEWRAGWTLGILAVALPITLIAYGERWVSSGVAAIGIAATPLFVQLLARRFRPGERVAGVRLAGLWLGLAGVALLAGAAPGASWADLGGTLAIVGAALCFAVAGLYAQTSLARAGTLTIAAASSICGGIAMLPFALARLPEQFPSGKAIGAVLGLTVVNSIAAQLLSWHIVHRFGPARNSLSTYLTPPLAVVLGVVALGESAEPIAIAALALILVGVALGSGVMRLRPVPRPT